MRIILLTVITSLLLATSVLAKDQCDKAGIDHAGWDEKNGVVSAAFKVPIKTPEKDDHVLWSVFDQTAGSVVPVTTHAIEYSRTSTNPSTESTSVTFQASLNHDHKYLVSAINLQFKGCPDSASVMAFSKIDIKKPGVTPAVEPAAAGVKAFAISPAKGRDDADLYIAGLVNGATGTKASYTADIKAQFRYLVSKSSSGGDEHKFRSGIWFVPNFDLKASTDPKADGNSVTMGAALPSGHPLNNQTVTWVDLEPGVQGESDKQFRDINTVFRFRSYFLVRNFGSGRLQFLPQPYLGFEAGGNVKSPVSGAYAGGIARPSAGVHVYLNFFKAATPGRQAFVESEYIRRWPLRGEPVFSQDKSGNLVLNSVGTSPRDYVTTKVEYDFADYFGITVQHDYGELPPVFTKVNNKYTIGLVLKTGLVYKPK